MSHDDRPGGRPAPEVHMPLRCDAPGCQWAGSAGSTGRYHCIAHQGAEVRDLSAISERTTELLWFAAYITDVQRMHNQPRKGEESWIAYADNFWAQSDATMQPSADERRNCAIYLYRMFGELRAMALGKDRPLPHTPQAHWPGFTSLTAQSAGGAQ